MPLNVLDLAGSLTIDTKGAEQSLTSVNEHVGLLGKVSGSVTGAIGGLARGLATFGLAAQGVSVLKGAFTGLVDAAAESQKIGAQTEAVLKSTGGAAGVTAKQVGDLATSLSMMTPVDDEVIQSTENLLLTFTGIGKDIFPEVTKTALDMSVALGQDTKASAIQLGKALNDPIKGITALTRVGVTFTEAQKTQIQTMVAAGDTMGAQKVILAELTREFGGSAEAAGKTFGGQLAILKTQLGNVQEAIGLALLPSLTELATNAIPYVISAAQALGDYMPTLIGHISDLAGLLTGPLNAAWVLVRDTILTFKGAIEGNWVDDSNIRPLHRVVGEFGLLLRDKIIPAVTTFADFLTGTLWPALKDGKGFVDDLIGAFKQGDLSGALSTLASGFTGLASKVDWGKVASDIVTALVTALGTVTGIAWDAATTISGWLGNVQWGTLATTLLTSLRDALKAGAGLVWDAATTIAGWVSDVGWGDVASVILGKVLNAVTTAASLIWDAAITIKGWISEVGWADLAGTILNHIWNGIVNAAALVWDAATTIKNWISDVGWLDIASSVLTSIRDNFDKVTDLFWIATNWLIGALSKTDWNAVAQNIMFNITTALNNLSASTKKGGGPDLGFLLDPIAETFKNLGSSIGDLFGSVGHLADAFGGLWKALGPWADLLPPIKTVLEGIGAAVLWTIINTILGPIKLLTGWFESWAAKISLAASAIEIANPLIEGLGNALVWVKDNAPEAARGVAQFAKDTGATLVQLVTDAGNDAKKVATAIIDGIKTIVTDGPQQVIDMATNIGTQLTALVGQALTAAGFVADAIINGIKTIVEDGPKKIVEMGTALVGALTGDGGISTTIVSEGVKIGVAILEGIASGLADFVSSGLDAAIQAVADHIPGWLKKLWGITSPAKAMIPIGVALTEGIAVGIMQGEANAAVIARASGFAVGQAYAQGVMQGGGATGGAGGGGAMNPGGLPTPAPGQSFAQFMLQAYQAGKFSRYYRQSFDPTSVTYWQATPTTFTTYAHGSGSGIGGATHQSPGSGGLGGGYYNPLAPGFGGNAPAASGANGFAPGFEGNSPAASGGDWKPLYDTIYSASYNGSKDGTSAAMGSPI